MAELRIGVDLGGTKIEAAALDDSGRVVARRRRPTPAEDYERTLAAVAALVDEIESETGRHGSIGVGIPGTISPMTGLVKNSNSTWLNGQPFDRDLARRLGRPIRVANDANCFAISEAVDGAAAGAKIVFGVILGTGVGRRHRHRRPRAAAEPTPSPANGGTIRCPPPRTRNAPARSALAAGAAASRPGSVARRWCAITSVRPADAGPPRRSVKPRPKAMPAPRRLWRGWRSGSHARWAISSISSTPR